MAEGYGYDHDCEGKGYLGGGGLLLRWCKIVKMVKRSFRLISVLDFHVVPNKLHFFSWGAATSISAGIACMMQENV